MPAAAPSDRFSGQNMADCGFCPPTGRRFRTQRQCGGCSQPLCLVCRPEVPGQPFRCPDCGGGSVEDALHMPSEAIARIQGTGAPVPFWLTLLQERMQTAAASVDDAVIPE